MRFVTALILGGAIMAAFATVAHAEPAMIGSGTDPFSQMTASMIGILSSPFVRIMACVAAGFAIVQAIVRGSAASAMMGGMILITFFFMPSVMEMMFGVAAPQPSKTPHDGWMIFGGIIIICAVIGFSVAFLSATGSSSEAEESAIEELPVVSALPPPREERRSESEEQLVLPDAIHHGDTPRNQRKVLL